MPAIVLVLHADVLGYVCTPAVCCATALSALAMTYWLLLSTYSDTWHQQDMLHAQYNHLLAGLAC